MDVENYRNTKRANRFLSNLLALSSINNQIFEKMSRQNNTTNNDSFSRMLVIKLFMVIISNTYFCFDNNSLV